VAVFDDVLRIVQDDVVQERPRVYATDAGRLFDQPRFWTVKINIVIVPNAFLS
jgi:hypothetical protein